MGKEFVPEAYTFKMTEAVATTSQTLIGSGNCFSVKAADGEDYNIVNFYIDDNLFSKKKGLETLLKEGLTWPIKIAVIGKRTAVINDPRISDDHYRTRFCEVCCPMDLLPLPQRLTKARRIMDGSVSFIKAEACKMPWGDMPEMVIESTTINYKK